jgi:nucleotide-binding universal stress UspA family protein
MTMKKHHTYSAPTIVVGFDFTEYSTHALDQALRLSGSWPDSRLIVIWGGQDALLSGEDHQKQAGTALERLSAVVNERVEAFKKAGISLGAPTLTVRVTGEGPADALRHTAFLEGADLIVVGSSEKSTLEGVFLGSVSRELMKRAPCSVMVSRRRSDADMPKIDPPAPAGHDSTLGRRHTYHYESRVGQPGTTLPLLIPMQ